MRFGTKCPRLRRGRKPYIEYLILFYMEKKVLTKWIILVCVLGGIVLFLFPEPESNFLAYLGTALLFVLIIIKLSRIKSKKK